MRINNIEHKITFILIFLSLALNVFILYFSDFVMKNLVNPMKYFESDEFYHRYFKKVCPYYVCHQGKN